MQFNKYTQRHKHTQRDTDTHTPGWKKKRMRERVRSIVADPDNPENSKGAGRETQSTGGLCNKCISRERMSPLSRLIRYCCNKYH